MIFDRLRGFEEEKNLLYGFYVQGNPFLHMLAIADEYGQIKQSHTNMAKSCQMTRQAFRTYVEKMKSDGILEVIQKKERINGNWVTTSNTCLNLNHPYFNGDKPEENDKPTEQKYPDDFLQDWVTYCGKERTHVGSKTDAYYNWRISINKHGRDIVMEGTVRYVKECEAKGSWKKSGAKWWNPTYEYYLDEKYHRSDETPEVALWNFLNSRYLDTLLNGDSRVECVGDKYMVEALLLTKGTDRDLGQTRDRLRRDDFNKRFCSCYEIAMRLKEFELRNTIYSNQVNSVIWRINE